MGYFLLLDYLKKHNNVLIFAYFGVDGLPKTLIRVSLEYFINGITKVMNLLNPENKEITFIGNSKGAEATLLIVSKYFNTNNIVACLPGCYAWQGITKTPKDMFVIQASWTYQNKDVPYMKMKFDIGVIRDLMNKKYRSSYEKGIKCNLDEKAKIDISNFKGKMLILSDEKDNYWPSKTMSETIIMDFNIDTTHKVLNQTVHYFQDYEEPIKETIAFFSQLHIN